MDIPIMKKYISELPPGLLKDELQDMLEKCECGFCPSCSQPIDQDQVKSWPKKHQKLYHLNGFCYPCQKQLLKATGTNP